MVMVGWYIVIDGDGGSATLLLTDGGGATLLLMVGVLHCN